MVIGKGEMNMSQLVVIELDMLEQMINEVVARVLKIEQQATSESKLAYTSKEVAEMFNLSLNKINMLRNLNAIKAIKKGREYLYPRTEIEKFLRDYIDEDLSNEITIRKAIVNVARKDSTSKG